jgi:hypothetical protein
MFKLSRPGLGGLYNSYFPLYKGKVFTLRGWFLSTLNLTSHYVIASLVFIIALKVHTFLDSDRQSILSYFITLFYYIYHLSSH